MVDQHSTLRVKLSDLIEGMDFQSDEQSSFLNLTTGEVVSITDEELRAAENDEPLEDFPDWQHDAIRIAMDIVETEHYLPLPDRFEINVEIQRSKIASSFLETFVIVSEEHHHRNLFLAKLVIDLAMEIIGSKRHGTPKETTG